MAEGRAPEEVDQVTDERFLVTGSDGCIGSWVLKILLEREIPAVALDLAPEGHRLRKILADEKVRELPAVAADITAEGVLRRVMEEHEVTRVVHLAALQVPFVKADPFKGALVNVVGTVQMLEAARQLQPQVKSVAYASSAAAYGPPGRGLEPATLYGVFKLANEECARVYAADHGLRSVGLRPWAVFGPGRDQGLTAAPTKAMKAAVLGSAYHIPFGGQIDLQYAPDVAEIFIAAALAEADGASVHNLRGWIVDVDQVIATIEEIRPEAKGLLSHSSDEIPIQSELDDSSLQELLGGVRWTEPEAAVRATIEHFARLHDARQLSHDELAD